MKTTQDIKQAFAETREANRIAMAVDSGIDPSKRERLPADRYSLGSGGPTHTALCARLIELGFDTADFGIRCAYHVLGAPYRSRTSAYSECKQVREWLEDDTLDPEEILPEPLNTIAAAVSFHDNTFRDGRLIPDAFMFGTHPEDGLPVVVTAEVEVTSPLTSRTKMAKYVELMWALDTESVYLYVLRIDQTGVVTLVPDEAMRMVMWMSCDQTRAADVIDWSQCPVIGRIDPL